MQGFEFNVEWDKTQLAQVTAKLAAAGSRLRPLLVDIGEGLLKSTQDRFQTKRAPDGSPWAPLKKSTTTRKKGRGSILVLSGILGDTIHFEATDMYIEISSALEYSALHQFGGTADMPAGPAAVPARPFIGISADDAQMIDQRARDYLATALG